jgi:zinc/manganese transport system substrate-binding protein
VAITENGYHFGMPGSRHLSPGVAARALTTLAAGAAMGLVVIAVVTIAAGCGSTSGAATGSRVAVVAGENVWGGIAAQIGGARVRVTSLISDPNADPHLFQANAVDAGAMAHARIVIENGAGYDDFMGQLLSASGAHPAVIDVQRVLGETGANVNPHFWYDVARVPLVAQAVERALAAADPAGTSAYEAGSSRFDASLRPTLAVIAQIKRRFAGQPVAYTERVPGYLIADAGLTSVTPPGFAAAIESGNEPSASDTQAMQSLIAGHRLRLLLYNTQATSAVSQHMRALAQQAGIPVVGVSETRPSSDPSYQAWQLRQAREILQALGGRP